MPKHQLSQNASNESTISIHILLNAIAEATCSLDAAGQVTFCNETFLMVTGFRAEEIIGKSLHDLVHHHSLNGSSLNGTGCGKNGCVLCGTPNQQRQIHVVGEMLWRKNGTFFPGEYWLPPCKYHRALHNLSSQFTTSRNAKAQKRNYGAPRLTWRSRRG